MDERACIELATALGATGHGGWRDLIGRVTHLETTSTEAVALLGQRTGDLAKALGTTSFSGWDDLIGRVKAISSMPDGPGRVYDQVKAALGERADGGGMPWLDLVAEVKATRELADSVKDVTRDLAEAMGMARAVPGDWPALLDRVRQWRADRETPSPAQSPLELQDERSMVRTLLGLREAATSAEVRAELSARESQRAKISQTIGGSGTVLAWDQIAMAVQVRAHAIVKHAEILGILKQVSEALGCHDTNVAVLLDAITRLKEAKLLAENERGTALLEERAAHVKTKAAYGDLMKGLREALDPVMQVGGSVSVTEIARTVVAEVLSLREQVAGLHDQPDDVCEGCGGAYCDNCHVCHECVPADDDFPCPKGIEPEPAISALESLTAAMATDPRDWAASRLDAWMWGVIVGWPPAALDEVASRHGWPDEIKSRLRVLHAAVLDSCGIAP